MTLRARWPRPLFLAAAAGALVAVLAACSSNATINDAGGGPASVTTGTVPAGTARWTTYHHDAARTGVDPSSPAAGKLSQAWERQLDGAVYAEPLVVGSVVYVATEQNSVYALDAKDGRVRWVRHLATPVDGVVLPCGNIDPSGITGTPVIDPGSRTLYVVAFESTVHHELFALDLDDGSVLWERSADPPNDDPSVEQQRGALSLLGDRVVVPYGGLYGDCGDYHGWLVSFPTSGTGPMRSFQVPNERQAGIWAPPGAVTTPDGDLLVATGNGISADAVDGANSVLRLSPELAQLDSFAPKSWAELNEGDLDLGTTSPVVVGSDLVFQIGKEGVGYLLHLDDLGGVGGAVHSDKVCRGAFGGTAVVGSTVYVPCLDGLFAVHVRDGSSPTFTVTRTGKERFGPPVVSGGVIWAVTVDDSHLEGFDLSSGRLRYRFPLGQVYTSFPTLAAVDGRLFVPAGLSIVSYRGA